MIDDVGRPSRGGVDRNGAVVSGDPYSENSRPSRGGVDRNSPSSSRSSRLRTSPLARGRGSKLRRHAVQAGTGRRPSRGGVDRNADNSGDITLGDLVAPRAGAWIETFLRSTSSAWST